MDAGRLRRGDDRVPAGPPARSGRCSPRRCRRTVRRPAAGSRYARRAPRRAIGRAPRRRAAPRRAPRPHADQRRASVDLPDALGPMTPSACRLRARITSCTTGRCAPGGTALELLDCRAATGLRQRRRRTPRRRKATGAPTAAASPAAPRGNRASSRSQARPAPAHATARMEAAIITPAVASPVITS